MKTQRTLFLFVAVSLIVLVTSACRLGERRQPDDTQNPVSSNQPAGEQATAPQLAATAQPSATAQTFETRPSSTPDAAQGAAQPTVAPVNGAAPTQTAAVQAAPTEDTELAELLNLLDQLDSENQAGDSLTDLP